MLNATGGLLKGGANEGRIHSVPQTDDTSGLRSVFFLSERISKACWLLTIHPQGGHLLSLPFERVRVSGMTPWSGSGLRPFLGLPPGC